MIGSNGSPRPTMKRSKRVSEKVGLKAVRTDGMAMVKHARTMAGLRPVRSATNPYNGAPSRLPKNTTNCSRPS
eukprot:scaffold64505_cov35-Prasinocladus_malaysianus.AAC.2